MSQKMHGQILNVYRPLQLLTRYILLDFLRWDKNVGRYKPNHGLLPKIIIGCFVFTAWLWVYVQEWAPPTIGNDVELNHFIVIFELLATAYAPTFLWIIRYLLQYRYIKLYEEMVELDNALEAHGVRLSNRFLNKTPVIIATSTVVFDCFHVLMFFYARSDDNVRKSLCVKIIIIIIIYNAIVLIIFTVLYLRDRIIVINEILVKKLDPNSVVNCNRDSVPFEEMCVVHVLRCVCILYDKYVDIFDWNTKISRSQIVTINSIVFVESILQGYAYIQIILLDKVYDWKANYINIMAMITNATASFFITYLLEEVKEERNRMMRLIHRIYLRSKSKATIQEDVQAASLHILHKPLNLSIYGLYNIDAVMFITGHNSPTWRVPIVMSLFFQIVHGIIIFSCMVINLNNLNNGEKIV